MNSMTLLRGIQNLTMFCTVQIDHHKSHSQPVAYDELSSDNIEDILAGTLLLSLACQISSFITYKNRLLTALMRNILVLPRLFVPTLTTHLTSVVLEFIFLHFFTFLQRLVRRSEF